MLCNYWIDLCCSHFHMLENKIYTFAPLFTFRWRSFSYEGRWKQKLQTTVDFQLDSLDLAQYVIGPKQNLKKYSLYGVSVSSGVTHCSELYIEEKNFNNLTLAICIITATVSCKKMENYILKKNTIFGEEKKKTRHLHLMNNYVYLWQLYWTALKYIVPPALQEVADSLRCSCW